ncbi:MAG: ABC transporter permease [Candidatus Omnitrophica bacterium]|nr:ABC transporter permease [Candidatus Omnitrophota bacterium]
MLRKIIAFVKKDFLVESSYRFALAFNIFGILTSLLGYFFIDKLFGHRIVNQLEEFGVNYFSYALLSTAVFGYVGMGLSSFSERIRYEQVEGTLEAILLTPTRTATLLTSMALWNMLLTTVNIVIYAVIGSCVFKIDFTRADIPATLMVFFLTILSFSSLGILSASFIMVFKRGNPVGWIIGGLEGLIGGVYFPVAVLPVWLQALAQFFPITHAIRAVQLSVYKGYSIAHLGKEICFLSLFSIVLLPLSFFAFNHSIRKARIDGSLSQY